MSKAFLGAPESDPKMSVLITWQKRTVEATTSSTIQPQKSQLSFLQKPMGYTAESYELWQKTKSWVQETTWGLTAMYPHTPGVIFLCK